MSIIQEIENTEKTIEFLKDEEFDVQFRSPHLTGDEKLSRVAMIRDDVLKYTQRLASLLAMANETEGTHRG